MTALPSLAYDSCRSRVSLLTTCCPTQLLSHFLSTTNLHDEQPWTPQSTMLPRSPVSFNLPPAYPAPANATCRACGRPHRRHGAALRLHPCDRAARRERRLQHHCAARASHQGGYHRIRTSCLTPLSSNYPANTSTQIRAAQDLSSLIRELQELWLFGGLDTLTDPADEEANKAKALGLAALVEVLALKLPVPQEQDGKNGDR